MRRRGWKRADWLVRDEESGFTEYASSLSRDYYGILKRTEQNDQRHPQDFVIALRDPYPVAPTNPPLREYDLISGIIGDFVGTTTVPVPFGPASHLLRAGIGFMRIEFDFVVF